MTTQRLELEWLLNQQMLLPNIFNELKPCPTAKQLSFMGLKGLVGTVGRTHTCRAGYRSVMDFKAAEEGGCIMWDIQRQQAGSGESGRSWQEASLFSLPCFGLFFNFQGGHKIQL